VLRVVLAPRPVAPPLRSLHCATQHRIGDRFSVPSARVDPQRLSSRQLSIFCLHAVDDAPRRRDVARLEQRTRQRHPRNRT
jgi:hypothetical protein